MRLRIYKSKYLKVWPWVIYIQGSNFPIKYTYTQAEAMRWACVFLKLIEKFPNRPIMQVRRRADQIIDHG